MSQQFPSQGWPQPEQGSNQSQWQQPQQQFSPQGWPQQEQNSNQSQWQQPQQQYQQYPPQQYPPQQPPKKKSKLWLWIVLGVVAVLLFGCIGVVALITNAAKNTVNNAVGTVNTLATQPGNTLATQPGNTSNPSNQHFALAQTVKAGDNWQVTVNSAKTSKGDQFSVPKAGNIFVVVDVTLKNLSGQAQIISSAINFSLQDATGQKYTETIITGATPPDGSVASGALLRGQLTYEVPTAQHQLTFNFEPDIVTGNLTNWTWDIKV